MTIKKIDKDDRPGEDTNSPGLSKIKLRDVAEDASEPKPMILHFEEVNQKLRFQQNHRVNQAEVFYIKEK